MANTLPQYIPLGCPGDFTTFIPIFSRWTDLGQLGSIVVPQPPFPGLFFTDKNTGAVVELLVDSGQIITRTGVVIPFNSVIYDSIYLMDTSTLTMASVFIRDEVPSTDDGSGHPATWPNLTMIDDATSSIVTISVNNGQLVAA